MPPRCLIGLCVALCATPSLALAARASAPLLRASHAAAIAPPQLRTNAAKQLRMAADEPPSLRPGEFKLYPYRWVQLGYLSVLALLSDWVCFSVAAAPSTFEAAYNHDPATLIDIFLFTNVLFCLLEPAIVRRAGLRNVVVGAGTAMAVGCALRSGLPTSAVLQPYSAVVAGTVLVGAAQPFFQCTPPLLSATWFGADERALATAVAINFNQVGIATAFLVGGAMATSSSGLGTYFNVITIATFIVAIGAALQFRERPPTPPTGSAAARIAAEESEAPPENFLVTARQLLQTPGFLPPLCAFVGSIAISNVVSAFVEETLTNAGFASQATIDYAGAGFQAAIVLGGIVLGGYVDRTKAFKQTTLVCLGASLLLLLPLGLDGTPKWVILPALLALGALVGPVQPINAELAVEVAYPADENSIEALQQLCGNLFSALLVPVAERAARVDLPMGDSGAGVHGDTVLLGLIALGAFGYFTTFDAELKRSELDCESDPSGVSSCDVVMESVPQERPASAVIAQLSEESPPKAGGGA